MLRTSTALDVVPRGSRYTRGCGLAYENRFGIAVAIYTVSARHGPCS